MRAIVIPQKRKSHAEDMKQNNNNNNNDTIFEQWHWPGIVCYMSFCHS